MQDCVFRKWHPVLEIKRYFVVLIHFMDYYKIGFVDFYKKIS